MARGYKIGPTGVAVQAGRPLKERRNTCVLEVRAQSKDFDE